MTLRRSLLIAAAAILVPMGGALALTDTQFNPPERVAQRSSQPNDNRRGFQDGRWMEALDLSPEQSEQIQAIREQSRQTMEPLREQMQQAREQLRSLMASNTATDDDLRAAHEEVQNLHQRLGSQRFETTLKIRQVLTTEQRTQMAELMEQHREQRGRGRGFGGQGNRSGGAGN